MASTTGAETTTFPAADAEANLNPGEDKDFQVDPISSEVATSLELKEQLEAAEAVEKKKKEKKDPLQTLKKAVIVSAVVVAIAGAAFAITKKLKEK